MRKRIMITRWAFAYVAVGLITSCHLPKGLGIGEESDSTLKNDLNLEKSPSTQAFKEFYGAVRDLKQKLPSKISERETKDQRANIVKMHVLGTIGELGGMPRWQVHALLNQLIDEDVGACGKGKTCTEILGYKPSDIETLMNAWFKEFTSQNPCGNQLDRYRQRIARSLYKKESPKLTQADLMGRIDSKSVRVTISKNYPTKYPNPNSLPELVAFEDWENMKSFHFVANPTETFPFESYFEAILNLQELHVDGLTTEGNREFEQSVFAMVANKVSVLTSKLTMLEDLLPFGYLSNLKEVELSGSAPEDNIPYKPLDEGFPSPFPYARKLTVNFGREHSLRDIQAYLRFVKVMPVLRELNIVMPPVTRIEDLTIEPLPKGIQTITHTCIEEGKSGKETTPHLFALYANAQNVTLKGCTIDYLEPMAQRAPNRKIQWKFLAIQECKSKVADHLTIPGRNLFPNLLVPSVSFENDCRQIYPDDLSMAVSDTIKRGQDDQSVP